MATTFGVSENDLNTPEERDAIRKKRQEELNQQKMMMAAQVAGKAIRDTSQKPEDGSPAQQVLQGAA